MSLLRYLCKLVVQGIHLSISTRRPALLVILFVAPILTALALIVQLVAPFAVYPFV